MITGCSQSDGFSSSEVNTDDTDIETLNPSVPSLAPNPYKPAGWYAKTEVSATASNGRVYQHTTAGVFGELKQSEDGQDQHDVPGYGAAILQVIMVPDFTTNMTVGYFSDYKKYEENSTTKKVWTFQVKNQYAVNLADAPITIDIKGVYDVEYRDDRGKVEYKESTQVDTDKRNKLTLIDVDNAKEYTVIQLSSANLTMQGVHTRTFRWVKGTVDNTDYEPLSSPQRAAGRQIVSEFTTAPETTSKFGDSPQ